MRIYKKTFNCSENFPIQVGETFFVYEGKRVAERWTAIWHRNKSFTVQIVEYFPKGGVPPRRVQS